MEEKKYNREEIIKSIDEKGANLPCHRCGQNTFALIDGFSRYHLSDNMNENTIGGSGVPIVLIACNNCGAITPHAALALIKTENNQEKKEGHDDRS